MDVTANSYITIDSLNIKIQHSLYLSRYKTSSEVDLSVKNSYSIFNGTCKMKKNKLFGEKENVKLSVIKGSGSDFGSKQSFIRQGSFDVIQRNYRTTRMGLLVVLLRGVRF